MELNAELIARVVAEEISTRYQVAAETTPSRTFEDRHGNLFIDLPVEQRFGIFDMVFTGAHIGIRAGEVESPEDGKHMCVFVTLNFKYLSGGTNGANVGMFWIKPDGTVIGFRAE